MNEYYIFNNEGNNIECRNNPPQNIKNCTSEMTANQDDGTNKSATR